MLDFPSPEKEKLDNLNIDQPRLSQEFQFSQSEQEIPLLNFSLDNIQQNQYQKDEPVISTPQKDTFQLSSFTEAIAHHNNNTIQQSNRVSMSKHLLSPTSSQSSGRSRSSLSSPVSIKINPNQFSAQMHSTRRSLNYDFSQIQEKRLEDEKTAISYAEKVLQSRNFLSQQKSKQENQRYSLFVTTAQQAGVLVTKEGGHQGILKKKNTNNTLLPPGNVAASLFGNGQQQQNVLFTEKTKSSEEVKDITNQMTEENNNKRTNRVLLPDRSELNGKVSGSEINSLAVGSKMNVQNQNQVTASSKVRGRRTIGSSQQIDLLNANQITVLDKKTLTKITKENTERNSVIQPERSMEDHHNRLPRCFEHSKRIKELYCVDEDCQVKNKFGCVLCFSSVNGSPHSFHQYYNISTEEDLQKKINRNRSEFTQFIKDKINAKGEQKNSSIKQYQEKIVDALESYANALQDRLFIGFEAEEIQQFQLPLLQGYSDRKSPTRKSKRIGNKKESYDEKELSIVLYLDLLAKHLDKKNENKSKIWLEQQYLGEKDEEFQREKRCKLIMISKCFSNLNEQVLEIYTNSEKVVYDLDEYENINPQLYYESDQFSDGFYQMDSNQVKYGRGIQFLKSGNIYEGYFKNNQKHGKGKLITYDGELYIGEFSKNLKRGKGVLKYSNNDVYTGEFYQDICHGIGSMFYASDSTTYIGGWNKNQRHGKGQIFKDNQVISSGTYIENYLKTN